MKKIGLIIVSLTFLYGFTLSKSSSKTFRLAFSNSNLKVAPVILEDFTRLFKLLNIDMEPVIVPPKRAFLNLTGGFVDGIALIADYTYTPDQNIVKVKEPIIENLAINEYLLADTKTKNRTYGCISGGEVCKVFVKKYNKKIHMETQSYFQLFDILKAKRVTSVLLSELMFKLMEIENKEQYRGEKVLDLNIHTLLHKKFKHLEPVISAKVKEMKKKGYFKLLD